MTKQDKSFGTGLRVLEILKILLNENLSKNDLIEKLKNISKVGAVYTKEAFIKYFNTLEMLGFRITKDKNIYKLENSVEQISFTDFEKELFYLLIKESNKLHDKKKQDVFAKLISRLEKFFNTSFDKNIISKCLSEEKYIQTDNIRANVLFTLKNLLADGQMVKITYQRTKNIIDEIVVEIKEIQEKRKNIFVVCYCPTLCANKKIPIDAISSLVQLPSRTKGGEHCNTVIFRLYGRLAATYKLKQSEKVIDFNTHYITVSNSSEDKDALLRRLLKYGESCEIRKPQSVKEEFLIMTNEILKNLQGED